MQCHGTRAHVATQLGSKFLSKKYGARDQASAWTKCLILALGNTTDTESRQANFSLVKMVMPIAGNDGPMGPGPLGPWDLAHGPWPIGPMGPGPFGPWPIWAQYGPWPIWAQIYKNRVILKSTKKSADPLRGHQAWGMCWFLVPPCCPPHWVPYVPFFTPPT